MGQPTPLFQGPLWGSAFLDQNHLRTHAMGLTKERLTQIWRAGFCAPAVLMAGETEINEGESRLSWMKGHLDFCSDCKKANFLKSLEHAAACQLGPAVERAFHRGDDITGIRGANIAIAEVLNKALMSGTIDQAYLMWMSGISVRQSKEFDAKRALEDNPRS